MKKSAFSLIELSIVILIASILITGVLSMSNNNSGGLKTKITEDRIKEIYKALGNYLLINHHLPCPAALNIAKGSAGYGIEKRQAINPLATTYSSPCHIKGTSSSNPGVYSGSLSQNQKYTAFGAIPVATLGLPSDMAEDGFGSKFTYIVSAIGYENDGYPSTAPCSSNNSSDYLGQRSCASGTYYVPNFGYHNYSGINNLATENDLISIFEKQSNTIIDNAIFTIISYGANKYGAFNASSATQNGTASTDLDEQQNYISSVAFNSSDSLYHGMYAQNSSYPTKNIITATSLSSDVFDDVVFYKTKMDVIADFKAMFLVPCVSISPSTYPDAYYGQMSYRNTFCDNPSTAKPYKKCEAFGAWTNETGCANYSLAHCTIGVGNIGTQNCGTVESHGSSRRYCFNTFKMKHGEEVQFTAFFNAENDCRGWNFVAKCNDGNLVYPTTNPSGIAMSYDTGYMYGAPNQMSRYWLNNGVGCKTARYNFSTSSWNTAESLTLGDYVHYYDASYVDQNDNPQTLSVYY
jgi:prepilin-type N-terminal cleavage/methylation domain-containing protein